jgi:hypothetical protein
MRHVFQAFTVVMAVLMSDPATAAAGSYATTPDGSGLLVIGAGFGRTGTSSMQAALQALGFGPTHHMGNVMQSAAFDEWTQVAEATDPGHRRELLAQALQGYRSCVDAPTGLFYKDLIEMYPDAKVILTTRDDTSWFESAWDTILCVTIALRQRRTVALFAQHSQRRQLLRGARTILTRESLSPRLVFLKCRRACCTPIQTGTDHPPSPVRLLRRVQILITLAGTGVGGSGGRRNSGAAGNPSGTCR